MYKEGQRILERQRFAFPPSWLYVDNIEGEWGAFNDILKRKDSSIQTQVFKKKHVPHYFLCFIKLINSYQNSMFPVIFCCS